MSDLIITQAKDDLDGLVKHIHQAESVSDLKELRARIEAAKAWARTHKQLKKVRLDLLRLEVEALVRCYELGGEDELTNADLRAAEWLHAMSEKEREDLLRNSGGATTATGMCRTVWAEQEAEQRKQDGMYWAEHPTPPPSYEDSVSAYEDHTIGVRASLTRVLEDYTSEGAPFTVNSVADDILAEASISPDALDPAFVEGTREVVRRAIRSAQPLCIDGTVIPLTLTVLRREGDEEGYVRIPTMGATVAHAQEFLELRRAELAKFEEAVQRVQDFVDRLQDHPDSHPEARIGGLLLADIAHAK